MGELTLTNPWLLAGLAGASLPILIHLIGRRRAPTVFFAAFDFLLAVNKRLARRERLRQFLLLLLRTLAIIALVLAVTRPMPPQPVLAGEGGRRLVLIVDTSASMGYRRDGTSLLEHAKVQALQLVSHLQPGDPVTLVVAGQDVRTPFQSPTVDHAAVRAAINAIAEPKGTADLGAAIEQGLAQLGQSGAGAVLAVVTDLSANSFEGLRPSTLDPPPEVRLIDAAAPLVREEGNTTTALSNLAIESVRVEQSRDQASERKVTAVVRNYGSLPVNGTVELVLGGNVTHRGFLEVPARSTEEKVLTHNFDGPGIYEGTVRLVPDVRDGYPFDDQASFVTEVVPGVRVLAVNGDPRNIPYEDELFFLERAIAARPRGDPPIEMSIVTVDELHDTELGGFDVVILSNVATLPGERLAQLRTFLRAGGGILFTMGDRIKFEAANLEFGSLLPTPLRDLHRAHDPHAGSPPIGIGDIDWEHPIVRSLGLEMEQALRASQTKSYFNLGIGAGLSARAVLRFDNGAPALVERREGDGRVMMLTTSIDVDLSDLCLRSAFPPLLQRTVRYLAQSLASERPGQARVGGTVELSAPTGSTGLALTTPSGARREVIFEDASSRRAVFRSLDEVGIHRVEVQRGEWSREPRLDFAVNASLAESDFIPVSVERVSEALGGSQGKRDLAVTFGAGAQVDPFELRGLAPYLLMALCLLFVGESLLASRG